ncbi:hypothetical protein D3C84_1050280 [compost metagenome]
MAKTKCSGVSNNAVLFARVSMRKESGSRNAMQIKSRMPTNFIVEFASTKTCGRRYGKTSRPRPNSMKNEKQPKVIHPRNRAPSCNRTSSVALPAWLRNSCTIAASCFT